MSIFIEKVRIYNFRSLKDIEITLSPNVTLLVGTNNSGKTTLLQALNCALNSERIFISQNDLFIDQNGSTLEDKIINIDVKIIPHADEKEFDQLWINEFGSDITNGINGNFFAFRAQIDFNSSTEKAQIKRYVIRDWENNIIDEERKITANLKNIPFHFIDAQRDLQEDSLQRTSHFGRLAEKLEYDESQKDALEKALTKLNNDAIEQSEVLSHLCNSLQDLNRTVKTDKANIEITPFPKKVRDLHKGMKIHFQDINSDAFGLEYHGMGTRSWASLLAFKAKISWEEQEKEKENEVFFPLLGLEEPEAHLHPNAQRQVYRQLSGMIGQKIISTHSPYIAALAGLEEIRSFYKEKSYTEVNSLDINKLNIDEIRKVKREILLREGELLFSRAIVLYEGETEAQALPIFAREYWKRELFEMGITFISVSGNNYMPFVLLAEMIKIPWFIFSDYDTKNVKGCINNVENASQEESFENIIKLEDSIEKYLISESYQQELKKGINAWYLLTTTEDTDQRQIIAGSNKINSYSDESLENFLLRDDSKVRYPAYWAEEIIKLPKPRNIPPKIRELFDMIDNTI